MHFHGYLLCVLVGSDSEKEELDQDSKKWIFRDADLYAEYSEL